MSEPKIPDYNIDDEARKCVKELVACLYSENKLYVGEWGGIAATKIAEYMRAAIRANEAQRKTRLKMKLTDTQVMELISSNEPNNILASKYNITERYVRYLKQGNRRHSILDPYIQGKG
jgi:hypothetical protein